MKTNGYARAQKEKYTKVNTQYNTLGNLDKKRMR